MLSGCILHTTWRILYCRLANKVSGVLYTTSAWGFRVARSYCGGQCEGLDAWNGRQYGSHAFLLLIFSGGEQGKKQRGFIMNDTRNPFPFGSEYADANVPQLRVGPESVVDNVSRHRVGPEPVVDNVPRLRVGMESIIPPFLRSFWGLSTPNIMNRNKNE